MTKTSGICTVLREEGGTARPGESNERKVFIAESRRRRNKALAQEMFNVQHSLFVHPDRPDASPTVALMIDYGPLGWPGQ